MDLSDRPGPLASGPVSSPRAPSPPVLSVSELLRDVRALLERGFPRVWVEGEISNFSCPRSGHWYFTLKDENAQMRCAMFRSDNRRLDFRPEDGMSVLARGRLTLYEARGDFQLVVETLEETGDGALRRAFEALKQRLLAEGLFDEARKRPLPALPRRIGVLTSPTGAALHDILSVLRRRFPAIPVRLYPIPVQGEGAAREIARMLRLAGRRRDCDVLILARGGGSLEDLWAFNEEIVARAVAESPIPVITGIGHQVDFTIADFCADLRAPTPSAAAEAVVPDADEWRQRIGHLESRLHQAMDQRLERLRERLDHLQARLRHPRARLEQLRQRGDDLERRLLRAWQQSQEHHRRRLDDLVHRLHAAGPRNRLAATREHLSHLEDRLRQSQQRRLERERTRLHGLMRALHAISPLGTLDRGYALVEKADGPLVQSVHDVAAGERIRVRLHDGRIACRVEDETETP